MNLEEGMIDGSPQVENLRTNIEEVSRPKRKSNGIRKTKVPNRGDLGKSTNSLQNRKLQECRSKQLNNSQKTLGEQKTNKQKIYPEKNDMAGFLFQCENEESFESMCEHTKSVKCTLPKNGENLSENKFIKTNSKEFSELNNSKTHMATNSSLHAEDVTKVFKIILKSDQFTEQQELKSSGRVTLKTYSNPRKSLNKSNVVESFALPDNPIVPEVPTVHDMLNTTVSHVREITLLELHGANNPWILTNMEGEELFPDNKDIRVKVEPQKYRKTGTSDDFMPSIVLQKKSQNLSREIVKVNSTPKSSKSKDVFTSDIEKVITKPNMQCSEGIATKSRVSRKGRINQFRNKSSTIELSVEDEEFEMFSPHYTPNKFYSDKSSSLIKRNLLSHLKIPSQNDVQDTSNKIIDDSFESEMNFVDASRRKLRSSVRCEKPLKINGEHMTKLKKSDCGRKDLTVRSVSSSGNNPKNELSQKNPDNANINQLLFKESNVHFEPVIDNNKTTLNVGHVSSKTNHIKHEQSMVKDSSEMVQIIKKAENNVENTYNVLIMCRPKTALDISSSKTANNIENQKKYVSDMRLSSCHQNSTEVKNKNKLVSSLLFKRKLRSASQEFLTSPFNDESENHVGQCSGSNEKEASFEKINKPELLIVLRPMDQKLFCSKTPSVANEPTRQIFPSKCLRSTEIGTVEKSKHSKQLKICLEEAAASKELDENDSGHSNSSVSLNISKKKKASKHNKTTEEKIELNDSHAAASEEKSETCIDCNRFAVSKDSVNQFENDDYKTSQVTTDLSCEMFEDLVNPVVPTNDNRQMREVYNEQPLTVKNVPEKLDTAVLQKNNIYDDCSTFSGNEVENSIIASHETTDNENVMPIERELLLDDIVSKSEISCLKSNSEHSTYSPNIELVSANQVSSDFLQKGFNEPYGKPKLSTAVCDTVISEGINKSANQNITRTESNSSSFRSNNKKTSTKGEMLSDGTESIIHEVQVLSDDKTVDENSKSHSDVTVTNILSQLLQNKTVNESSVLTNLLHSSDLRTDLKTRGRKPKITKNFETDRGSKNKDAKHGLQEEKCLIHLRSTDEKSHQISPKLSSSADSTKNVNNSVPLIPSDNIVTEIEKRGIPELIKKNFRVDANNSTGKVTEKPLEDSLVEKSQDISTSSTSAKKPDQGSTKLSPIDNENSKSNLSTLENGSELLSSNLKEIRKRGRRKKQVNMSFNTSTPKQNMTNTNLINEQSLNPKLKEKVKDSNGIKDVKADNKEILTNCEFDKEQVTVQQTSNLDLNKNKQVPGSKTVEVGNDKYSLAKSEGYKKKNWKTSSIHNKTELTDLLLYESLADKLSAKTFNRELRELNIAPFICTPRKRKESYNTQIVSGSCKMKSEEQVNAQGSNNNDLGRVSRSRSKIALFQNKNDSMENEDEKLPRLRKTIPRSKSCAPERIEYIENTIYKQSRGRSKRKSFNNRLLRSKSVSAATFRNNNVRELICGVKDVDANVKGNQDTILPFEAGTIAWAQIGNHPFWPCLVIGEPNGGIFKKSLPFKNRKKIMYHVRFFGDQGRRAWVNQRKVMAFYNRNDLEILRRKLKAEKNFNSEQLKKKVFVVRSFQMEKWLSAVEEAELVKTKKLKAKLSYFDEEYDSKLQVEACDDLSVNSEPVSGKRKKINSSSSGIAHFKEKAVKRVRKEILKLISPKLEAVAQASDLLKKHTCTSNKQTDSTKTCTDLFKSKSNDDVKSEEASNCVQPNFGNENSEIESKTASESTISSDSYSITAQKALFKRNNLFKGVPREKVCQHCFLPDEVLKCRGRCNGSYHFHCAIEVMDGKPIGKGKNRNIPLNTTNIQNTNANKLGNGSSEENKEAGKFTDETANDIDEHVQIITVPSSVYNTPPRKSFPPGFKDMSLAEQIDYKMQEIMKKFESNTTYAKLLSNSCSEENTANQLSPKSRFTNCQTLFLSNSAALQKKPLLGDTSSDLKEPTDKIFCNDPEILKLAFVNHVTAESLLDETNSTGYGDINETDAKNSKYPFIPHVTADSFLGSTSESDDNADDEVEELVENKQNNKKTDKTTETNIVNHVTADGISYESVLPEESNSAPGNSSKQDEIVVSMEVAKLVNPKKFKCGFCSSNTDPFCFVCCQTVSKYGSTVRHKCSLYQCGRFYHPECLKLWPQTQWSLIQTMKHKNSDETIDSFVCPQHVCHTCASDDPRAAISRCPGDKIVKCLRCPSTYHSTSFCVPAGTDILSPTQIICPRHRPIVHTINTTWCFLCSKGGNLICCETCPTSVHPECLPVNLTDDDKFICEDCESGRLPLYDEIVWVKLGTYRWWPGLILFPNEIPANVMNIKHSVGEFVVKFFGTYDHYWVNRGRSFLFQEGDTASCNNIKKKVDANFNKAVKEAVVAHKLKKEFKLTQEAESMNSLKPPPYIKIKCNKPVGNARQFDLDLSNTTACDCDPSQPNPCGPDSDCLNRLLMTECNPEVCPAGERCKNQSFEKREYPPLLPYKTQGRGWGLKTLAPIRKGQFVIEYVGEMIDDEEYQRRIVKMHQQKEENYYFLTIDKDRMIDAGPKGNMARFMNHCCQPNCETQKWTVNGDTRVGLFATKDIPTETELTFNYNLESVGKEKKVCRCGAPNCSGFIGVKAKQETKEETKKPKKTYKKKKTIEPTILPPCFICHKKGNVGSCNNKVCNKAYHLECLKLKEWPEGNKFVCPWHNCNTCSKRTIRCCVKCVNSFCPSHSDGNVRYDNLLGFVCNSHDPSKPSIDENPIVKMKKKKSDEVTEESAVTSTTSDDIDEDNDEEPLLSRMRKKSRKFIPIESDSDDFDTSNSVTSTPFKKPSESDQESQDENTVSSATLSDIDEYIFEKKRNRRSKTNQRLKKKIRLSNELNQDSTANSNNLIDVNLHS